MDVGQAVTVVSDSDTEQEQENAGNVQAHSSELPQEVVNLVLDLPDIVIRSGGSNRSLPRAVSSVVQGSCLSPALHVPPQQQPELQHRSSAASSLHAPSILQFVSQSVSHIPTPTSSTGLSSVRPPPTYMHAFPSFPNVPLPVAPQGVSLTQVQPGTASHGVAFHHLPATAQTVRFTQTGLPLPPWTAAVSVPHLGSSSVHMLPSPSPVSSPSAALAYSGSTAGRPESHVAMPLATAAAQISAAAQGSSAPILTLPTAHVQSPCTTAVYPIFSSARPLSQASSSGTAHSRSSGTPQIQSVSQATAEASTSAASRISAADNPVSDPNAEPMQTDTTDIHVQGDAAQSGIDVIVAQDHSHARGAIFASSQSVPDQSASNIPQLAGSQDQPVIPGAPGTPQPGVSHVQPITPQVPSQADFKSTSEKTEAERGYEDSDDDSDGCPICFESYTNSGQHRMASLKCGHLFGLSCIEKWLKGQGGKCPQCNSKAKKCEIRVLYAKVLKALDTSERDRALQDLEKEREARIKAELDEAQARMRYQQTVQECMRLREELERKKQEMQVLRLQPDNSQNPGTSEQSAPRESAALYTLDKAIKVWEAGGCRVMAYNSLVAALVVSQPSSSPLFPGFGVKKISSLDFRTSQYVAIHGKAIRDVAFNPASPSNLLLSGSMDKTIKMTSMNSNAVVQSYTNPVPVWACCWNHDDSNYFYGGLMNGTVCVFDSRNTSDCVSRLNTDHKAPIVSLHYVQKNPHSSFRHGGLLVGQIDRTVFYEGKPNGEYKPHILPLEGNLVSLSFEESTRHILATYRPTNKHPSVRHQMYELTSSSVNDNPASLDCICTCNHISTFHGGSTQKLLTRTRLIQHPTVSGQLLGCAGDEASSTIQLWDPSSGQLKQKMKTTGTIIDMCTIRINDLRYLATMTEKQVFIYKCS